jgi:hypothetical protein
LVGAKAKAKAKAKVQPRWKRESRGETNHQSPVKQLRMRLDRDLEVGEVPAVDRWG